MLEWSGGEGGGELTHPMCMSCRASALELPGQHRCKPAHCCLHSGEEIHVSFETLGKQN
jgi:hypothetical protein